MTKHKTAALKATPKPKIQSDKPLLIRVGKHLIDPFDVAVITRCRDRRDEDGEKYSLYVVKLKSNPNPEYPIWVQTDEAIEVLLEYFNIEE